MKKFFQVFSAVLIGLASLNFGTSKTASATSLTKTYVNLTSLEYSSDSTATSAIPEYETLDEFLVVKNSNALPTIYITDFLYDGVGAVKSPDLDDFIDSASNETKIKTLEIKAINVNTLGDVEFTGEISGAMIAVDTNGKSGELNLILNNVTLDTDSKKSPAVYVYNKDRNYTDLKVTIKTAANSKNYLEGGKLKKVSLVDSENLSQYSSKYSGDALTNYNAYSNYYGIYTAAEIENILFATVTADAEDLQDGDPLYFYKASGAISSDIDLYFEGEGYLEVTSKNKEGIETKGNLTLAGGTGDYVIRAQDDCLNTTTASSAGSEVRNTMSIDVNSLTAIVSDDGDEGDAIDSNGSLIISGGTIYAYAHSDSEDSGLDSETGTTISGATILATGNMADSVQTSQSKIFVQFTEKVAAGSTLTIKDQDNNIITTFTTEKTFTALLYTSPDLEFTSFKIYNGETELSYREVGDMSMAKIGDANNNSSKLSSRQAVILIILASEIAALAILILVVYLNRAKFHF